MMLLVIFLILMALLSYIAHERNASYSLAIMACFGAWILWAMAYFTGDSLSAWQAIPFLNDGVSRLLTLLVLLLGTLILFYSWGYLQEEESQPQHIALLLLLMAFAIAVCQAGDMFNLWLWFEGLAIAATMLVAFQRDDELALEATFKYLIQSAAASTLILAGIALVFAQTGALAFSDIHELNKSWHIACLFVIGFGVKAAFVPLHTWLPDAHSQAPSGISAMLSGVVIEVALIAMLRCLTVLGGNFGLLLMGFALLNILVGNFLALKQDELKRLLAFSSVAHLGYIALGLGIGLYTGEISAYEGSFFHLLSHGLMKSLAFLSVGTLLFIARGQHLVLRRDNLRGLGKAYPMIGFALATALLGLGGLPPMVGFISKWQIFVGGAVTGDSWVLFAVLIAAFGSILSLGYYAPLVSRIYQETLDDSLKTEIVIPLKMRLPIIVLILLVLLLGFYPLFISPLLQAAAAVFGH